MKRKGRRRREPTTYQNYSSIPIEQDSGPRAAQSKARGKEIGWQGGSVRETERERERNNSTLVRMPSQSTEGQLGQRRLSRVAAETVYVKHW